MRTRFSRRLWISIPLVSAAMDTVTEAGMAVEMARAGGIGVIHRFMGVEEQAAQVEAVKQHRGSGGLEAVDGRGRLLVAAAVGVRGDYLERASRLYSAGADAIVIDVAHAHTSAVLEAVKALKRILGEGVDVVVGNIATGEAAADLISAGADALKVGIGPGSVCSTRIVAGVGVPQLTAIMSVSEVARGEGVPVIADGGVRSSGDAVKALAAGAESVMLGYMLAGTDEAPGKPVIVGGRRYKIYRGMASASSYLRRLAVDNQDPEDLVDYAPEGLEALVPYRGPARDVIASIVAGIRSGMAYVGAGSIEDLWERARFVTLSPGSLRESYSKLGPGSLE